MSETSPDPVAISRAAAAVVGFLARYSSKATVSAYSLDLRLLFQWCAAQGVDPLDAEKITGCHWTIQPRLVWLFEIALCGFFMTRPGLVGA